MANVFSDEEIKNVLEKDLLELIGGADLPQAKKQELYTQMAETVQNRTIARIYDKLSEEDGKALDEAIDSGDKKNALKVDEFLKSKNIDITSLLAQEAIIYKTEMMELFKTNSAAKSDQ